MSASVHGEEGEAADMVMCCASCGKAEVDDVKLKQCACKLVRYCSVDCQKNHRPLHKKACKKQLAQIRDDKLFTQPEISHYGECPICCLPLPLDAMKSRMNSCCSELICNGCSYANSMRELEGGLEQKCPFCRLPMPTTQEESYKRKMKRVKANDPVAMNETGMIMRDVHRNYEKAVEYFTKAAALGESSAHYNLACLYNHGLGVERDAKKEFYHMEEAAIGGHPVARYNLGYYEGRSGRIDRAMKHFIISAKLGYDEALEEVKKGFQMGDVSKEDYAAALRGHQAAVDATKSAQRNAAEEYYDPSQDMRRMVQSLAQAQD